MRVTFGGKASFWQYDDIDPAVSVLTALRHMDKEADHMVAEQSGTELPN